jgi:hypothetical protein
LVGDALFELLVEFLYFICSFAQFFQKPRVLNGDDSLGCEIFNKCDLFIGEGMNFSTVDV